MTVAKGSKWTVAVGVMVSTAANNTSSADGDRVDIVLMLKKETAYLQPVPAVIVADRAVERQGIRVNVG